MAAGSATKIVSKTSPNKKTVNQQLTASTDVSDWVQCTSDIAIQLSGTATAVTAVVERSTNYPAAGVTNNASPVSSDTISGNPATGVVVNMFYEPGVAWWRVRLTALTGAYVTVSISTSGE